MRATFGTFSRNSGLTGREQDGPTHGMGNFNGVSFFILVLSFTVFATLLIATTMRVPGGDNGAMYVSTKRNKCSMKTAGNRECRGSSGLHLTGTIRTRLGTHKVGAVVAEDSSACMSLRSHYGATGGGGTSLFVSLRHGDTSDNYNFRV